MPKKIDHDVDHGDEGIDHQGDDDEELQGRAGTKIVAALAHGRQEEAQATLVSVSEIGRAHV